MVLQKGGSDELQNGRAIGSLIPTNSQHDETISTQIATTKWEETVPLILNRNAAEAKAMNRKSPLKFDNAIGCVLLWIAVIRPDRRTAMKWLRVGIRERNRKA